MSELNNLNQPDRIELDDDLLARVQGGLSLRKSDTGYTVYDHNGDILAFFTNAKEVEIFAKRLISTVGKDCGIGLSWLLTPESQKAK